MRRSKTGPVSEKSLHQSWTPRVVESPSVGRAPLLPFKEIERKLSMVNTALRRPNLMAHERCLLEEESRVLEQDLAARPFNLRVARLCEVRLRWLVQKARTLGITTAASIMQDTRVG